MKTAEYREQYNDQTKIFGIVKEDLRKYFEEHLPQYNTETIAFVPASKHPDDWYLFRVSAKLKEDNSMSEYLRQRTGEPHDWSAWTCWNETSCSLNFGHYHTTEKNARDIMVFGV